MNLKNCNIIYIKTFELNNLINHNLKGKIIVSDFPEFQKICNIYGLIHVLNTNTIKVPDGIDCIITSVRNPELESRITRVDLGVPIVYYHLHQKWCGICGKLSPIEKNLVGRYCSESCMKKSTGFTNEGVPEAIKDLHEHKKALIKFDKSLTSDTKEESSKAKSREKFQQSMVKEAQRVEFAYRKESYKNEMRQPSHRKTKIINKKKEPEENIKYCKSMIKGKSKRCGNRALDGSDYCGISSHRLEAQLSEGVLQEQDR